MIDTYVPPYTYIQMQTIVILTQSYYLSYAGT